MQNGIKYINGKIKYPLFRPEESLDREEKNKKKNITNQWLVLCQEIVQNKKRKFYYPARTSFSLDWLARYNFSNSLGDKYPQ